MELERLDACILCQSRNLETVDAECCFCRCSDCGHIFDNPRPTAAEIVRFYSKPGQYHNWLDAEAARDRMWQRRLRKLRRAGLSGSLLDVGSGIGQFLHHAKATFSKVLGTEVSAEAVQVAREKYGIELLATEFESTELPGPFDVVTLFHVLEHVPDPRRTVTRCYQVLRPGGTLVIAVPNDVHSLKQRTRRILGKIPLLKPRYVGPLALPRLTLDNIGQEVHLSHFTPPVLESFLKRLGFTDVQTTLDPYYARSGFKERRANLRYAVFNMINVISRRNLYGTIWVQARRPRVAQFM
jgi:2-polyprenyl-3-methyl-5-hydroxy-6-metoxy-1,4-benzoquinol methylase